MTTPSGQISLSDVNTELGYSATALITMNDANVRTLAGVGGSGTTISMQNLQGKSNRVTANITISSDTANYTLNTAKVTSGYDAGKTDAILTINSGVIVSSSSTGSYALTVDTSWNVGDTVTIVNNGTILGRGGNGGGGSGNSSPGSGGGSAGPALLVQRALTMNNLNRIAGGGGGGGGGGCGVQPAGKGVYGGGGGGGGGGIGVASGGGGGNGPTATGGSGSSGTLTSAGGGGGGGDTGGNGGNGGPGGSGGTYGSSGSGGTPSGLSGAGGGGAAGACIVGNSNITYTNTGTRDGSIS